MKFKRRTTTERKVTITEVRQAHNAYGAELSRWGENNLSTQSALQRYWDKRTKYEAQSGKKYAP